MRIFVLNAENAVRNVMIISATIAAYVQFVQVKIIIVLIAIIVRIVHKCAFAEVAKTVPFFALNAENAVRNVTTSIVFLAESVMSALICVKIANRSATTASISVQLAINARIV